MGIESVQQKLAGWIVRYAGAVNRVVKAYGQRCTRWRLAPDPSSDSLGAAIMGSARLP